MDSRLFFSWFLEPSSTVANVPNPLTISNLLSIFRNSSSYGDEGSEIVGKRLKSGFDQAWSTQTTWQQTKQKQMKKWAVQLNRLLRLPKTTQIKKKLPSKTRFFDPRICSTRSKKNTGQANETGLKNLLFADTKVEFVTGIGSRELTKKNEFECDWFDQKSVDVKKKFYSIISYGNFGRKNWPHGCELCS